MRTKIHEAEKRLSQIHLKDRAGELIGLPEAAQRVDESILKLTHAMDINSRSMSDKLTRLEQVMSALNPSSVLNRGYSYVTTAEGSVITSAKDFNQTKKNTKIDIIFHDGKGSALKD
jgi:exodeoxyribonuclease VII large subunit